MLTPAGVLTEFPVTTNSGPADVVVGNDGELWFSEGTSGKIGRMVIEASGSKIVGDLDGEFATPTTNARQPASWWAPTATLVHRDKRRYVRPHHRSSAPSPSTRFQLSTACRLESRLAPMATSGSRSPRPISLRR